MNVERDVLMAALSPLDILEQKEENIRLYRVLASLPEKQKNRIYAHYFLGMSKAELGQPGFITSLGRLSPRRPICRSEHRMKYL